MFFIPNQRGQMFMQTSLCMGGMLNYACLHVQDAWVEALHILIGLTWTLNKLKKAREGLKPAQGSTKSHSDCSSMNLQEQTREASKHTEPTLQGPPVYYSGKDKLPGASIHSQQPLLGPADT